MTDAYGYCSEAGNFDYRYGMALERRDLNNFYYETDIGNLGRIKAVGGPNEQAAGIPYVISFDYHPIAEFTEKGISVPAYAVIKHIYIGSQCIVSKLGDLASYGAASRCIPYAGTEADGISMDYVKKYLTTAACNS